MSRAEIVDSSPVEVLLDYRGRDVRVPRHCRRISELLRDSPHDIGHGPLLLGFDCREPLLVDALREVDGGEERSAPCPEVLGSELLPEVDLHVVVQALAREVVEIVLPAVLEDARPALYL